MVYALLIAVYIIPLKALLSSAFTGLCINILSENVWPYNEWQVNPCYNLKLELSNGFSYKIYPV